MKKSKTLFKKLKSKSSGLEKKANQILQIEISEICANRSQPRKDFDANSLVKLADSIKRYGILQPLVIRRNDSTDQYSYELIAGERRLRAAKMLGMAKIPCVISDVEDRLSAELALVENLIRENLNMFDQANAFAALSSEFGLTQEEIAQKMSLSQSAVANKIRLLKLTENEQRLITDGGLTERHARAFLRIPSSISREKAIKEVMKQKLNVSQTEQYISELIRRLPKSASCTKKQSSNKKPPSFEVVHSHINRYIEKLSQTTDLVSVERASFDDEMVITLHIKNSVS